jgi:protein kinase X
MLLDFVNGGELFLYLRNAVKFSSEAAIFYTVEIVSAFEYLHGLSIIYRFVSITIFVNNSIIYYFCCFLNRDLKPENLLLDCNGHLKICDFGFAKKVVDRTWTLCGTPEYLAPEIIQGKGHHKAVDWWALGILIYEMLAGYPPFYDEVPFQIYQKILAGKIDWPRSIDLIAKDLIKKLLTADRTKRFGTMKNGVEDIKKHKWFKNINWNHVYERKLVPPIVPTCSHAGDTKNFERYEEDSWKDAPIPNTKSLHIFDDF